MNMFLDQVLESLKVGSLEMITKDNMIAMSNLALEYIKNPDENLSDMVKLVKISNILYNNTDFGVLPLEDSIYDQLVNLLLKYTGSYPVGAIPIDFKTRSEELALKKKEKWNEVKNWQSEYLNRTGRWLESNNHTNLLLSAFDNTQVGKQFM